VTAVVEVSVQGRSESGGRRIWLVNPVLGWANSLDAPGRTDIPPGATRYADVGRWVRRGRPTLEFVLSVLPEPGSRRHVLESGAWDIHVTAVAENAEASNWRIRLSFSENPTKEANVALRDLHADVRPA